MCLIVAHVKAGDVERVKGAAAAYPAVSARPRRAPRARDAAGPGRAAPLAAGTGRGIDAVVGQHRDVQEDQPLRADGGAGQERDLVAAQVGNVAHVVGGAEKVGGDVDRRPLLRERVGVDQPEHVGSARLREHAEPVRGGVVEEGAGDRQSPDRRGRRRGAHVVRRARGVDAIRLVQRPGALVPEEVGEGRLRDPGRQLAHPIQQPTRSEPVERARGTVEQGAGVRRHLVRVRTRYPVVVHRQDVRTATGQRGHRIGRVRHRQHRLHVHGGGVGAVGGRTDQPMKQAHDRRRSGQRHLAHRERAVHPHPQRGGVVGEREHVRIRADGKRRGDRRRPWIDGGDRVGIERGGALDGHVETIAGGVVDHVARLQGDRRAANAHAGLRRAACSRCAAGAGHSASHAADSTEAADSADATAPAAPAGAPGSGAATDGACSGDSARSTGCAARPTGVSTSAGSAAPAGHAPLASRAGARTAGSPRRASDGAAGTAALADRTASGHPGMSAVRRAAPCPLRAARARTASCPQHERAADALPRCAVARPERPHGTTGVSA